MSDDNLPVVKKRPDFSDEEVAALHRYEANGLPGITKVTPEQVETMRRMYLDGMLDYRRIANDTFTKIEKVLYFAYKQNWHQEKMDRISSVIRSLENHTMVRADSIAFLQEVISNLQTYYRKKMQEIYTTGDPVKVIESMQMRHLEKYAKMLTLFESMVAKAKDSTDKGPLINFNVSGDAKIEQKADGSVDITSGSHTTDDIRNILKTLADMKRVQEKIDEESKVKK